MCDPFAKLPEGWKETCLKKSHHVAHDNSCPVVYCAPDGRIFRNLDVVFSYIDNNTQTVAKQEYVEQNDGSNDGESNDEDGIDGIFDFFNDSAKKKLMKEFKKKKALVEENSRKELDEMIVIHKRIASDLDQKHNQEILELSKKHAEANVKMTDKHEREREELAEKKRVKLESLTKQEEEAIKRFIKVLKGAKRKYDDEDDEEKVEDSIFECPICYEMMTPPKKIYQCAEGHLVCSECKPKIPNNNCATCQSGQGYISRCRWIEERIANNTRTKRVKRGISNVVEDHEEDEFRSMYYKVIQQSNFLKENPGIFTISPAESMATFKELKTLMGWKVKVTRIPKADGTNYSITHFLSPEGILVKSGVAVLEYLRLGGWGKQELTAQAKKLKVRESHWVSYWSKYLKTEQ